MACGDAAGPGDVIALVVLLPPSGRIVVEEEDTTRLAAWTLTQRGDSAADGIVWRELVPRGVIALDSAIGDLVGLVADDTTTIQARFANLRSNLIPVRVTAAADTIVAAGPTVDTVPAGESVSQPLAITLLDLTTSPGTSRPLSGRPVRFSLPDLASGVELVEAPDSIAVTRSTGSTGGAAVTLRRKSGETAADSVIVEAGAARAAGTTVPGSPLRFVVYFQ